MLPNLLPGIHMQEFEVFCIANISKCFLNDAHFSHTVYIRAFRVAANCTPIEFQFTFMLSLVPKMGFGGILQTIQEYISTIKDLNIRLQIRKYAISNEQGKSCLLYPCEQFSQSTNHFIWTERAVYAISLPFEFLYLCVRSAANRKKINNSLWSLGLITNFG